MFECAIVEFHLSEIKICSFFRHFFFFCIHFLIYTWYLCGDVCSLICQFYVCLMAVVIKLCLRGA